MPQILVSPPRVPPEQLPSNFQSVPDAVVSNADVNMCPNPSMELDARAQQQELDACAQQLVAGGATGDFVGEITRCFAKREAARIIQEKLIMANLNRRRMAKCATPDTVVSNADVNMCPNPEAVPDTVVSNADVNMCPASILGKRPTEDTVVSNADDARAQQQELDTCAQQLVAGGTTGDFVGEITRCFAKKEAARLEREQLLLANLNRRRMAQSAIPDTVVSNADVNMCPTPVVPYSNALVLPDTVVSNADVDMFPEGGVFIPQRLVRGPQNKGRIRKNCLTPTRWIERTRKKMSLPQYCYGPVINPTYVYPPIPSDVTGGPMPDNVVSNADVNMGLPYEDIDLPPVDDELIMDGVLI